MHLHMIGVVCICLSASPCLAADEEEPQLIRIRLKAAEDGSLATLLVDGKKVTASADGKKSRMDVLRVLMRSRITMKNTVYEAELDCDYHLKYSHVIEVINAISGYPDGDRIVPLVDKIKFRPARGGPDAE